MRYRYRTPVLLGTWYSSINMARADAVRAGQAYRGEDGMIIWRGGARIEAATAACVSRLGGHDEVRRLAMPRKAPWDRD
jgi:hypothetical protein